MTLAVRLGAEGVVIEEEELGAVESSCGVAEAVFDLGLPEPAESLALTAKVYSR